ncbi:MAG: hypothetical protein DHS20C10_08340 [marine bacterium B5-7]|nr:MAG: hypothetical protein DHS20C10_08340 [marine bacterium B5-7]
MSVITQVKRYFWEGPAMTALKNVYRSSFSYNTNKQRFQAYFFPTERADQKTKAAGILNTLAITFILLCLSAGVFGLLAAAGGGLISSLGLTMLAGLVFGGAIGMGLAAGPIMTNWGTVPTLKNGTVTDTHTVEEQGKAPAAAALIASMPFLLVAAVVMFTVDMLGGSLIKMSRFSEEDWSRHDAGASSKMANDPNQMQPLLGSTNDANDELPAQSHPSPVTATGAEGTDTANNVSNNTNPNTNTNTLH